MKTTLPKSAKTITSFVVLDRFFEIATNPKMTKFWVWEGRYSQMARGPVRIVEGCREVSRDRAARLAEMADRHTDAVIERKQKEIAEDNAAADAEFAAIQAAANEAEKTAPHHEAVIENGQEDLFAA